VKELAPRLLDAYKASRGREEGLVMGDSTSVRGLGRREMNQVKVLISCSGDLEDLRVNTPWPEKEVDVLVSDDMLGLPETIRYGRRQLYVLHGFKRLGFILWGSKVSLEERREALAAVKRPLLALSGQLRSTWWTVTWKGSGRGLTGHSGIHACMFGIVVRRCMRGSRRIISASRYSTRGHGRIPSYN
jgi:hypothetical protein